MSAKEHQIVQTADGSNTLYNAAVEEHYHSVNGALAESRHVFLESGLQKFLLQNKQDHISVLEIGFGTGLNFLLTADYCLQNKVGLNYVASEAYPLSAEFIRKTGYASFIGENLATTFYDNYPASFDNCLNLSSGIKLEIKTDLWPTVDLSGSFDVVYFDAFASARQPEMWTENSIAKAASALNPGGIFVTYAITGNLKRQFKAMGFKVEKAPGAPGKREMLRATRAVSG